MREDLRGNAKITRVSSHADLGAGGMGTDARELGAIHVNSVHANGRELSSLGTAVILSENGTLRFKAVGYTGFISRIWNPWI